MRITYFFRKLFLKKKDKFFYHNRKEIVLWCQLLGFSWELNQDEIIFTSLIPDIFTPYDGTLPDILKWLSPVKRICFRNSGLKSLPEWFGVFSNLNYLDLRNNQLEQLPDCFIGIKIKNNQSIVKSKDSIKIEFANQWIMDFLN